jgi:hypothetical protein
MSNKKRINETHITNRLTGNKEKVFVESNEPRGVYDPNLLSVEIYNTMKEEITFIEMNTPHPRIIKVKPDDFCYLPHQYFIGSVKSGAPISVVKNYGDNKFIGNKKVSLGGFE